MCFDAWVRAALMGERANIECFPTQAAGACLARRLCDGTGILLNSLYPAESRQVRPQFRRPLRHLVVAQRPLGGLELHAQQCGIFSGGNRTTAENLDRTKLAQLGEIRPRDGLAHLLERNLVSKHKRKIPFHCRIFSSGVNFTVRKPSLYNCSRSNSARKTSCRSFRAAATVRMNLPELGDRRRHSPRPGRTPGWKYSAVARS